MLPFDIKIDSDNSRNYKYEILNQSQLLETDNLTKGILKSVLAGTIILGISMTSNITPNVNRNLDKINSDGIYYGFQGNSINTDTNTDTNTDFSTLAEIDNDINLIKVTVIGNQAYEYNIENKSNISTNNKLLETINMKDKNLQSQIICSVKYYGDLPKNSLYQEIENDERLEMKKPTHYKNIVSPTKYMGKMPKKTIV